MALINLSTDDWDDLLQGDTITLGKTTVVISPLGIAQLKNMSLKVKALMEALAEKGINSSNFDAPENMANTFTTLVERVPELMEEATGINRDDIARLPLAKGVELLRKVIEVNVKSQETLVKNLQALGEAMRGLNLTAGA